MSRTAKFLSTAAKQMYEPCIILSIYCVPRKTQKTYQHCSHRYNLADTSELLVETFIKCSCDNTTCSRYTILKWTLKYLQKCRAPLRTCHSWLVTEDGNRSKNFITIQSQNHFFTTLSLTWQQLHDGDLHFCLHQDTLYIGNSTSTEATGHPAASLSAKNHSTPVFHFLHSRVKKKFKKKSNCKFIARSAILKPSNWHGSNYPTICFVIHYAYWKWLSSKVLWWTFPREAFPSAEGRLLSTKAHSYEIYYYCRAQWARVFTEVPG